jgi:succinate dehydrogenase / fumarate reductase flavoprotein subunit
MLMVSEAVASSALLRTESRGGHTREDHPGLDPQWRHRVLVTHCVDAGGAADAGAGGGAVVPRTAVEPAERVPMRADLLALFDLPELEKYYTPPELAGHPEQGSRQDTRQGGTP